MKKITLLILIGLVSFKFVACDATGTVKCESIPIPNTAKKEFEKENNKKATIRELVNFVNRESAAKVLAREDDYIMNLSQFDYASKFKSQSSLNEDERYEFYKQASSEWSDKEKDKVLKAVCFLLRNTKSLDLNKPDKLNFIKTNGYEEGGAAYTRGQYIIITEDDIENLSDDAMNYVVAHEFFHMYSRYNKDMKKDFYKLINFEEVLGVNLPSEIENLRITNPDAPITNYFIECGYKGKNYKFIPIIYANREFDIEFSNTFFDYLEDPLLAVEIKDDIANPIYVDGKVLIVEKSETDNFYKQTGENTYYSLHPEEIMADNFALYVTGKKIKSKWVIDGMLEIMKNNKAN